MTEDTADTGQDASQFRLHEIEEEMKNSYLDYAMSVIVGRALPDVRDGLKPVHRRVLYTMHTTGVTSNKPYRKSANIVGNCMARFHPHGDASIYDTLVRMTQTFSLRYVLADGQGNFGSIDGDNAAAMRYTEARMSKLSEELLADIDKETVSFRANFDNSTEEPVVLPSKVPNLLINGAAGIAVGMATNIPPHNLREISQAIEAMIDNPEITVAELMHYVTGPDFPTGGIIQGTSGIRQAYQTGRGRVLVRCRHHLEERKNGAQNIVVTEIPYQVNKAVMLEHIAELVKDKKIDGITDLRDETDQEGIRVVIELRQGVNADVILNQLYKHTRLQETFGMNMLALVDNEPRTLTLREMLHYFIEHRREVVINRTRYELRQAEDRAHVLEGLIIALDNIDAVIEKIKQSRTVDEASRTLMQDYELTERQAKVILEMRLQKLSSMEQEKVRSEYKDVLEQIKELKAILADESRINDLIKQETRELAHKYGDSRHTTVEQAEDQDIDEEDLIEREDMIVNITHSGYIKRVQLDTYKEQKRGGKGVIATGKKDDDFVADVFVANTHDYLLFFTNRGRVHWLKVYKLPLTSRQARGSAIVNLLELAEDERVSAVVPVNQFQGCYISLCTRNGKIKKTDAIHFSRPRRKGVAAVTLEEGDELVDARLTDGEQTLIIATRLGKAVRFSENDVRAMGRSARGVTALRLQKGDAVVEMVLCQEGDSLFTITENGYGKRSLIQDYRLIHRGGSGVRNIVCNERNGRVVSVKAVNEDDSVLIISQHGQGIRINMSDVSLIGRNTQGVRIMRMQSGDRVVAAAKIETDDSE